MRALIEAAPLWRSLCQRRGWRMLASEAEASLSESEDGPRSAAHRRCFAARYQCERNFASGVYVQKKLQGVNSALSIDISQRFVAAGKRDGAVSLLLVDSGGLVSSLRGHTDWVRAVSISGDTLVSGSSDRTLRVWKLSPAGATFAESLSGHSDSVNTVAALEGGEPLVASGGADGTVRMWDLRERPRCVRILEGHPGEVCSLAWMPPGGAASGPGGATLVSGGAFGVLNVWDTRATAPLLSLRPPSPPPAAAGALVGGAPPLGPPREYVWRLCPVGASRVAVCALYKHSVAIWDLRAGLLEREMHGHTDLVMGLGTAEEGRLLVSASQDGTARVWDVSGAGADGQAGAGAGACERVWQADDPLKHSVNCLRVAGKNALVLGTDTGAFLWSFAPPRVPLSALC
eukprot:tig00021127_g18724.t1